MRGAFGTRVELILGMLMLLLLLLLVVALFGGGYGHSRFGYYGWSPAAVIFVILIVVLLSGRF
ncbi:MAG TPA: hypothetical protein VGF94_00195 [Kofleriaceae bacterium]